MKTKRIALFLGVLFFIAGNVCAKDLGGKLGVGFNSQLTARDVSSISAKYWISDDLGAQGILGFYSDDDYNEFDMAGKILFKLKDEENLHVDAFGALGFTRYEYDDGDDDSGISMAGGLAIEFFFSGLPNLGFSSEVGLAFSDISDNSSFKTTSDTFITAGIHYYFDFAPSYSKEPDQ